MGIETQLRQGLEELGIEVSDDGLKSILQYQALLLKWNKVTNLTAITEPELVVSHHLLDALAVNPFIAGHRVLDVGSGGGLPGIPLALVNPDKDFILLDPNGKKTRFMTQAKIELGLSNVEVIQSRVEDHQGLYDHVISRAFRHLSGFVECCGRLLTVEGSLLAMKGPDYEQEQEEMTVSDYTMVVHHLAVPGLQAERCLIEIKPMSTEKVQKSIP